MKVKSLAKLRARQLEIQSSFEGLGKARELYWSTTCREGNRKNYVASLAEVRELNAYNIPDSIRCIWTLELDLRRGSSPVLLLPASGNRCY